MSNKEVLVHISESASLTEQIVYTDGTTYFPDTRSWYTWTLDLERKIMRNSNFNGEGAFCEEVYLIVKKAIKERVEEILIES